MPISYFLTPSDLREMADRIQDGIAAELEIASKGIPYVNNEVTRNRVILTFQIEPTTTPLDGLLDEGTLGWNGRNGQGQGTAEIIAIDPERSQIHGILIGGTPPARGQIVFVNPPRFLEPLLELWRQQARATKAIEQLFERHSNPFSPDHVPDASRFKVLRPAQRSAFELLGYRSGYLWGPPGTGKTYTLGRLLAAYLAQHREARILLLSTTNVAVDQAILSVDEALRELGEASIRKQCYRFGSRFGPDLYQESRHLIPVRDKRLIAEYRNHLSAAPDLEDPEEYKAWRDKLNTLRDEISRESREFLSSSRLAAMTATYAVFKNDDLESVGPFDLVVFDEASQVSLAHSSMIRTLGHRVLYAGDPEQLAPIVQSDDKNAKTWLGGSPFNYDSVQTSQRRFLDEQSRMAPPICETVSQLFYEGRLRVADKESQNSDWLRYRALDCGKAIGDANVTLLSVADAATPAPGFNGYVCQKSAELVAAIASHLARIVDPSEISVLTPYRAQRREIGERLEWAGLSRSLVSTVHRAQGSERRVVIFDPVRPSARFVNRKDGKRLLNVAFSRAKARLIVMVHPDYEKNDKIKELVEMHPLKEITAAQLTREAWESERQTTARPAACGFRDHLSEELSRSGHRERRKSLTAELRSGKSASNMKPGKQAKKHPMGASAPVLEDRVAEPRLTGAGSSGIRCGHCKVPIKSEQRLRKHLKKCPVLRQEPRPNGRPVNDPVVTADPEAKVSLKHMSYLDDDTKENWICSACRKRFISRVAGEIHIRARHSSVEDARLISVV